MERVLMITLKITRSNVKCRGFEFVLISTLHFGHV